MVRKFHKHKLLLDEGFPVRSYLPISNKGRIVITLNIKDFKPLAPMNKNTGVIGVSAGLPFDQVDKKLNSLLTKSTPKQLSGRLIVISGESKN